MCYISYQTDRYLAAQDRAAAQGDWLGMQAQNDGYSRYKDDAFEQVELNGADAEIAADTGELSLISKEGQELVTDLAFELATKDGFSRYE